MKKLLLFILLLNISISTYSFTFEHKGKKITVSDKLIEQRFKNIIHMYGEYFTQDELKMMTFNEIIDNHLFISLMQRTVTKQEVEDYYRNEWTNYSPDNEKDFIGYLQSYGGYETKDIILTDMEYRLKIKKASEVFNNNSGGVEEDDYIYDNKSDIVFPKSSSYSKYYDVIDSYYIKDIVKDRLALMEIAYNNYTNNFNPTNEDEKKMREKFDMYKKGINLFSIGLENQMLLEYHSTIVSKKIDFINKTFDLLFE